MKIIPELVDDEYVYALPATVADVFVDGFNPGMGLSERGSRLCVNRAAPGAASWRFRFSHGNTMVTLVPPLRFSRRRHAQYVSVDTPVGVRLHSGS
jgi:hypothetical protein